VRGQLSEAELDPDLLMWDVRRRIKIDAMPKVRTCLRFEFTDTPKEASFYWLIRSDEGIELCITDPGYEVDLYVTTDVRTMTEVWNGDMQMLAALDEGKIDLHGPTSLRDAFPSWLQLNQFAGIEAARTE